MLFNKTSSTAAILVMALISTGLLAHTDAPHKVDASADSAVIADIRASIPQPGDKRIDKETYQANVLNAELLDQNNDAFSLDDLSGRILLLQFIFTDCISVCPLQSTELEQVRQKLMQESGNDNISYVTITIAPSTDTPEKLRHFSSRFLTGYSSDDVIDWHFVTGKPDIVNRLGATLGSFSTNLGDGQFDHNTTLFLLDSNGTLRQQYIGEPVDKERLSREIKALASISE